ncbi:MAG: caspase family protein [Candidatus Protistobacter heckmanni]|nr:caspase family protein [Candidatus Protistobacter heckmanni]
MIGNSAYKTSQLRNPANDARAMAKALCESGFNVVERIHVSRREMGRVLREFGNLIARDKGTGLFYFAGHGMQIKGRNFLIPVGADIEREDEVAYAAIDAGEILGKMESAKNAMDIVILDACCNNPFARSFRSSSQGLAQMDAPNGSLVAYATSPGSTANDGDGANGMWRPCWSFSPCRACGWRMCSRRSASR